MSSPYVFQKQKNIPSLPHFLSVRFGGVLGFQEDWFEVLLNRIFIPDLILHSIPSVSVVINPVVPSLVYLISLAPEVVTV